MAKITMQEFYENAELLEATYIPFESKLTIALTIVESLIDSHGSINTTILRRTATEMILDTITNIDMSLECDEIGLNGYDYLYYNEDCYNLLMGLIGLSFMRRRKKYDLYIAIALIILGAGYFIYSLCRKINEISH